MRMLPYVDWVQWQRVRTAFCGYSDCTAILAALAGIGVAGFHGPVLESSGWDEGMRHLQWPAGAIGPLHADPLVHLGGPPADGWTGVLAGGNLTLVTALLGTPWAFPLDADTFLVLEDVGEAPYRIDRMLTQLKEAGVWRRVGGVVVGQLTRCDGPAGAPGPTAAEVVAERLAGAGIPVYAGLPVGHGPSPVTVPLGVPVVLRDRRLWLEEPAVAP
jgi:muramoyltetrapeptide carboxypeptidase